MASSQTEILGSRKSGHGQEKYRRPRITISLDDEVLRKVAVLARGNNLSFSRQAELLMLKGLKGRS